MPAVTAPGAGPDDGAVPAVPREGAVRGARRGAGAAFDVEPDGAARPAAPERPGQEAAAYRWIHRDLRDPGDVAWLHDRLGPLAAAALTASETRPRCQPMAGGMILNLRGVDPAEAEGSGGTVSVRIWVEPGLVVTATRRAARELDALRAAAAGGRAPPTRSLLVATLCGALVSGLEEVTVALEDATDDVEEALLRPDAPPPLDELELAELRRQAIRLRRYLAPQRDALARLASPDVAVIEPHEGAALREISDRATRSVEEIDGARDRLAALADHLDARRAARMGRHGYVLTLVAAVFLPLQFLTGLFGVNLAGIPFAKAPWSFGALALGCVGLGVGLWLVFRRRGWIERTPESRARREARHAGHADAAKAGASPRGRRHAPRSAP